jgi:alpha-amylase
MGILLLFAYVNYATAQNDVMMQAFYWNVPVDEANLNGTWWDNLASKSTELKEAGITGIWIPAPSKGNWGIVDMGYGIYDHYDLGNYNQKGTIETRFGSRQELEDMIAAMHNTSGGKPKINVYADAVLNHVYSSDENEESNPAVKGYVFDEAYRHYQQYVPYPTNEIKWVIPNATPGDYYIKIKGYYLNYGGRYKERAYDVEIDWTGAGFSGSYGWESEPNNGGGQTDDFGASGSTMRGFIGYYGDIDEYKIALTSTHDIVIKLTARKQADNGDWHWADQVNGYYPWEIWYNGQNLAATTLEARTNTHLTFPTHTGTGEANFEWNYNDFHPVDEYDFLTGWDWNGGNSAIIPNTKGFGNDFNTYSTTVQDRLNDWGYWMVDQIGFDGFRLDFVRGFQIDFVADWINNLPLLDGYQRFIVGEYWGPDYRIKNWVNDLAAQGVDADGFDFPLKSSLTGMCNGDQYSFDMRWLNHAGMVRNDQGNGLGGTSVVTWVDNHDTGKEHDKWVTKDWKMAYAYVLTHEGRPCVFYPHYYGVTQVDNHDPSHQVTAPVSLQDDINKLIHVRKTYLGGGLEVLSEVGNPWPAGDAHDVYVARRQGNGTKDGAIVVINNNNSQTKGLWVTVNVSGFSNWSNKTLKNALNGSQTTYVYGDGRAWLEAPPRGYAVYVLSSDYEAYTKSLTLDISTSEPLNSALSMNVYPTITSNFATIDINTTETIDLQVQVFDLTGRIVETLMDGESVCGTNSVILDLQGYESGMYIIKAISREGELNRRLIVR